MSGLSGTLVGELRPWCGGGPGSSVTITPNGDPGTIIEPISGWLYANGAIIDTATYPNLVAVLGTAYNQPGDSLPVGSVRLPNLQQKYALGRANSGTYAVLGLRGGSMDHTHTMGAHTHTMAHVHDLGSHTHGVSHTHTISHKHLHDHSHNMNIATTTMIGPQVTVQAGGSFNVPGIDHIHITNGTTLGIVSGGTGTGFTDPPDTASTGSSSIAATDVASPNTTGGSSASTTGAPSTNVTANASIAPPFQTVHYLVKY